MAPSLGWSVTKIVNQVMLRTENRASGAGKPDWFMEFWQALDEFTTEKHYWWRRKSASFQTVIGQQDYDLSSDATGSANAPDCEEIEEAFVVNADPQCHPKHVNPLFSARQVLAAIYGTAVQPEPIPHSGYFIVPGEFQQLSLAAPAQSVYTIGFTYWAVPMIVSSDVDNDYVPLVPPYLHWGLTYMLERRVYEYLYGQDDPRFVTSNARYEQFKAAAARSKQFSSQEAIHSQVQGCAVVSAGGRGWPSSRWGNR